MIYRTALPVPEVRRSGRPVSWAGKGLGAVAVRPQYQVTQAATEARLLDLPQLDPHGQPVHRVAPDPVAGGRALRSELVELARLELRRRVMNLRNRCTLEPEKRARAVGRLAEVLVSLAVDAESQTAELRLEAVALASSLGLPVFRSSGGLVPGELVMRHSDRGRVW